MGDFNRVRGEEMAVLVTKDGVLQRQVTNVKSFEATINMEIKEESYYGRHSKSFDDQFMGITMKVEYHPDDPQFLQVIKDIEDRATRRTPGVQFSIKGTVQFNDGRRALALFPNVFFGDMPFGAPSREEYLNSTLNAKCGTWKPVFL